MNGQWKLISNTAYFAIELIYFVVFGWKQNVKGIFFEQNGSFEQIESGTLNLLFKLNFLFVIKAPQNLLQNVEKSQKILHNFLILEEIHNFKMFPSSVHIH